MLTLSDASRPYRPPETRYHVWGRTYSRVELQDKANELTLRGDHDGAMRLLSAAGLTAWEIVYARERNA